MRRRYTVVEGDAPCVFTCCEREGIAAIERPDDGRGRRRAGILLGGPRERGRRPLEWRDCCEVAPSTPRAEKDWWAPPDCAGGRNRTTVYTSSSDCTQEGESRGRRERERERGRPPWPSTRTGSARHPAARGADAPAACLRGPRADCDRAACRNFKPGRLARNRGKFEITVNSVFRAWDGLTGSYWPGDSWIEVGGDEDDCRGKYVHHTYIDDNGKERAVFVGTSPPEARYCADDRAPAGVDVVPGVGTCCLNASGDASCVAKTAACFHGSGPRRCDVLLKYFGSFDRRTWEERDYWDTSEWNERSSPSVFAADGDGTRPRPPCDFRGEPYACDDLRCDPDTADALLRALPQVALVVVPGLLVRRSATTRPASGRGGARTCRAGGPGRPRRRTGGRASASASRPAAWSPRTATSSTRSSGRRSAGTRRGWLQKH